jgi:hypothetical protein
VNLKTAYYRIADETIAQVCAVCSPGSVIASVGATARPAGKLPSPSPTCGSHYVGHLALRVAALAHLSAWTTRDDIGMGPSATLLVVGFR